MRGNEDDDVDDGERRQSPSRYDGVKEWRDDWEEGQKKRMSYYYYYYYYYSYYY